METHVNRSFLNWSDPDVQTKTTPQTVIYGDGNTHEINTSEYVVHDYHNEPFAGENEVDLAVYPGFAFEVPVYLYIWPVLVVVTCVLNVVVCVVLLKKKMRNPTNTILATISVSDSLTGLVTIPVYLMVYSKWEDGLKSNIDMTSNYTYEDYYNGALMNSTYAHYSDYFNEEYDIEEEDSAKPAYILTKSLCRSFMLTRHYVSMSFHTISIWLTLFLGFQRFCVVRFPFRSQKWLCRRNMVIVCVIICVTAPILHVYHLFNEKVSQHHFCEWRVEPGCVDSGCVYIWLSLLLKHLFPCTILLVLTVLLVINLKKGSKVLERRYSFASRREQRKRGNRRTSAIVIFIVILFLIPEFPYGIFFLYIALSSTFSTEMDLETNRAITAAYEILLVLSFHANFWIYFGFNSNIQNELKMTLSYPVKEIQRRLSVSPRCSISSVPNSPKKQINEVNIEFRQIEKRELEKTM